MNYGDSSSTLKGCAFFAHNTELVVQIREKYGKSDGIKSTNVKCIVLCIFFLHLNFVVVVVTITIAPVLATAKRYLMEVPMCCVEGSKNITFTVHGDVKNKKNNTFWIKRT